MAGLYFHIPFCKRICAYCDFFRSADLSRSEQVAQAMLCELEARQRYLHDRRIRTIYFGGGTPSLWAPERLGEFITRAGSLFDSANVEETTLEANPDDLTPEYLAGIRRAGFDRLSIGIQSLDDDCLRMMNRRHTAAQAVQAVRLAQQAGFANITVDLIFGVPGFGGDSLRRSLEGVLSLGVQHISAYHLTVEANTAFGRRAARGELHEVDEQVSEEEFVWVHDALTAAGYEHYEVSNYALPGYRARHNAAYWHAEEYLGIGPGAHSFDGAGRAWNVSSIERYLAGEGPEGETLSDKDRYNEYVMTALRTAEGIDSQVLAERFGAERLARLQIAAAPFLLAGTLCETARGVAIPPRRMLLSDAVIEALFEL